MNIIAKIADNFIRNKMARGVHKHKEIIEGAKDQLYEIDSEIDKIKFLNIVLEYNNTMYDQHKPKCNNPESCGINYAHESIEYFLTQELNRLGVSFDEDAFTTLEKQTSESKLDKILEELATLKTGHQIIYDDLKAEIEDLKELYFLGKKKWSQLLLGKCIEMTAGGIISETVSKNIIETLSPVTKQLLG